MIFISNEFPRVKCYIYIVQQNRFVKRNILTRFAITTIHVLMYFNKMLLLNNSLNNIMHGINFCTFDVERPHKKTVQKKLILTCKYTFFQFKKYIKLEMNTVALRH